MIHKRRRCKSTSKIKLIIRIHKKESRPCYGNALVSDRGNILRDYNVVQGVSVVSQQSFIMSFTRFNRPVVRPESSQDLDQISGSASCSLIFAVRGVSEISRDKSTGGKRIRCEPFYDIQPLSEMNYYINQSLHCPPTCLEDVGNAPIICLEKLRYAQC